MEDNSQPTSPEEHPQSAPRDYLERNPSSASRSTAHSHSRTRYPDFDFNPGTVRRRLGSGTTSINPSPGPAHSIGGFLRPTRSRRSILVAKPSRFSLRGQDEDDDAASRKFSLAGPAPLDTLAANQPYVDPGYAQLNPAYDQPTNVRPVWGLAKPLPHVLRPGMVPAKDELEKEVQAQQGAAAAQPEALGDLEAGRIEPTLRPDKVADQLDSIRRERELSLFRAYQHLHGEAPTGSPFPSVRARRASDAPTETPYVPTIREEPEDLQQEEEQALEDEMPQLAQAIANVKQARQEAEEDSKLSYQDAIPLLAYDAEDDEIHNLHTYWSLIRLRFREPLAELLGIFVQYTLGFSANLSMTVSRGSAGAGDTGSWAWGLATMIAIYIAGGISGAHLNPAISLTLYIYRGFPIGKMPAYIVAQFVGAFLAALVSFAIFRPGLLALHAEQQAMLFQSTAAMAAKSSSELISLSTVLPNFITFARTPWVDTPTAFLTELVGTAILVIAVLALGDDTNAPPGAGMMAFVVGLLIAVLGMAFGYNTGLAMNPVRDFGPRVAMLLLGFGDGRTLFADGYWFKVAWLGPIVGAILGGLLYDGAIFVGGESPVNYPTRRIWRAARKWRERWRVRLTRAKRIVKDVKDDVVGGGYEALRG
ncbi:aquaporin-like protein [Exophiala viscosa]|uniref:aquaporin-like protein n=1 Tax=Exophiala viscosa TaxID=2486360 RepID=UPI002193EF83|nr:aquaporin-like protein [Exophiala viscosa]